MSSSREVQQQMKEVCEEIMALSDEEFDRELKYAHDNPLGELHVHSPEFLRQT